MTSVVALTNSAPALSYERPINHASCSERHIACATDSTEPWAQPPNDPALLQILRADYTHADLAQAELGLSADSLPDMQVARQLYRLRVEIGTMPDIADNESGLNTLPTWEATPLQPERRQAVEGQSNSHWWLAGKRQFFDFPLGPKPEVSVDNCVKATEWWLFRAGEEVSSSGVSMPETGWVYYTREGPRTTGSNPHFFHYDGKVEGCPDGWADYLPVDQRIEEIRMSDGGRIFYVPHRSLSVASTLLNTDSPPETVQVKACLSCFGTFFLPSDNAILYLGKTELDQRRDRYPELIGWLNSLLPSHAPADPTALAEAFRPRLFFDDQERWFPLDLGRFLGERFPVGSVADATVSHAHRVCPASVDREHAALAEETAPPLMGPPAETPDAFGCTYLKDQGTIEGRGSGDYLEVRGREDIPDSLHGPDPHCRTSPGDLDCDNGSHSAIYYHTVDAFDGQHVDANGAPLPVNPFRGYLFLDYWWFYRFNDNTDRAAAVLGEEIGIYQSIHVGDWEGMTVWVPKWARPFRFDVVTMSAHGHSWHYLADALTCSPASTAAQSCAEATARSLGNRVHAYVARGSHATYPAPCEADCLQNMRTLPEGDHGGQRPWGNNEDGTALRPLPPANEGWMSFNGSWGETFEENFPSPLREPTVSPYGPAAMCRNDNTQPCRYLAPWRATCTTLASSGSCPAYANEPRANEGTLDDTSGGGQASEPSQSKICSPWFGPQVVVTVCDPAQLEQSTALGYVGRTPGFELRAGESVATYSGDGVAQGIGDLLEAGDGLNLQRTVDGVANGQPVTIMLRARDDTKVYNVAFRDVTVGAQRDEAQIAVTRSNATGSLEFTLTAGSATTPPSAVELVQLP